MPYELKELTGVMFKDNQKKNTKGPDWRGEFLLNGVPHELAAWEKEGGRGTFLSFQMKPKQERKQQPGQTTAAPPRQRPASNPTPSDAVPPDEEEPLPF